MGFVVLQLYYLFGQNIIPNHSFEILTSPVTLSGQLDLAAPWRIDSQSPDLFAPGASFRFLSPPILNSCDTIIANSGTNFVGI
nr:hypothetical protein [Saprospiraceae bacterium]